MNRLLLSTQAYSSLTALPARDRQTVREALSRLKADPGLGLELWGRENLYLYQAASLKVVYRASGSEIQVVNITLAEELLPFRKKDKIAAVILAAGKSDYDKVPLQLMPVCGTPLIRRLTETFFAAGISDIIVVLGYQAERVKKELRNKDVKVVVNPDYGMGLSKSMRCGLRLVSGDTSAVALALGNRPFITPEVISRLVSLYLREKSPIIAPLYHQVRGHPVIFDTALIPELLKARGNIGGKEVIQRHRRELKQIEVNDAGIIKAIA